MAVVSCCAADSIADSGTIRRLHLAEGASTPAYLVAKVNPPAGKHIAGKTASPTRASLGHDEIDEYALVVVPQVGQVVGEVGEVVAGADLHVRADVTIDRGQRAAAALTDIRELEHVHSRDPKIAGAIHSGKAFLSRLDGEWRVRFSHVNTQFQ
jgi:hypothetical protein